MIGVVTENGKSWMAESFSPSITEQEEKCQTWINALYKDLTVRPNVLFDPNGITNGSHFRTDVNNWLLASNQINNQI